ncbi:MAG: FIST C-terminal domain-containing protein [Thermoleophilia bacterium]|nr:FIST C-terminal domain-containing protein [Thermoleophilia bacterium]
MTSPVVTAASALAFGADPAGTAGEAAALVRSRLGEPATLAVVFVHPDLARDPEPVLEAVHRHLAPAALVGCTGEGVIGNGREVEDRPAVSVWGAVMPGARITPIRAFSGPGIDGATEFAGWPEGPSPGGPGADDLLILLADPFTFRADVLLARMNAGGWHPPIVGGMASGGSRPGQHRLLLDGRWFDDGAVGVAVGGVPFTTAVSQGCAPIGPEMVVTDAEDGGVVFELAGKPAIAKLEEVIGGLEPEERRLAAEGLMAGLVIDENRPEYARGDFLVRGILGGDPQTGAVQLGEQVRIGQTLRLHVRDVASADEDLNATLDAAASRLGTHVSGALLFTCNGRGTRMFPGPDHDAVAVDERMPGSALAGFFCNGEIGPVGGRSFVHSFTATMAVFG